MQNTEARISNTRKAALAGFIGTAIEWYAYTFYGTAAALAFGVLFFPEMTPFIGVLLLLVTYGLGLFFRPLGGIVFGYLGDRIGRKAALVTTLLIMGVATTLIGLLPTYQLVGTLASILLIALRILQGFAIGGQWGGSVLIAVEHSPEGKRGFYGSWPQMGVPAGILLGAVAMYFLRLLPDEQFLAWGWRIPFLTSFVLVAIGILYIVLAVEESPAFQRVRQTGTEARIPIIYVLGMYPKQVLIAMGLRVAENGSFYVFSVFVLLYATGAVTLPMSSVFVIPIVAAAVELCAIPVYGALSDRFGRRPVYLFGAIFTLVFAFPFFWLVSTGFIVLTTLAVVIALAVGHAAMYGPQAAFLSELFGTRVRYSGVSLGYEFTSIFASALLAYVAAALFASTGSYVPVALLLCGMALITIVAVIIAPETYRKDISETDAAEERLISNTGGAERV